jgi:hypothetical protein
LIKKVFLYFSIVTLLLYTLRWIHYKGLTRQTKGYYGKYVTAFERKNNFDVLFLGSSRAEMAYATGLYDTLTGSRSFNLGTAGATPKVALAILRTYLASSEAPKQIVYEVDYHALKRESHEVREFNNFFPFLKNPTLRREFGKIDPRVKWFYYLPFYSWPYTGIKNISTSLHGWLGIPNATDPFYYNGFIRELSRPPLDFQPTRVIFSFFHPAERDALDSIIVLCKSRSIKLYLVSSPVFSCGKIELLNKDRITAQLNDIAIVHGLRYYDLSCLSFCGDRRYFVDHYHVNYAGARLFTQELVKTVNNKIPN